MKKTISIAIVLALVLSLAVAAFAAGSYTVTIVNGMDGSVYATYEVADGEDFVFTISCAPPADMGPVADGEAGSGVVTTVGSITYSNITLGGPNQYPTAETVTISGIDADATVTVTPNPLETGSEFPAITEGEAAAGGGSGEASSGEPSGEQTTLWDAYVDYLYDYLVNTELPVNTGGMTQEIIDDEFMPLIEAGNFEEPPAALLFNGLLDSGVAMTLTEFAAQYDDGAVIDAFIEYIHEWLIAEDEINDNMDESIRENEFMPLVRQMDFVTYPADMIYNGMLDSGVPMAFEEFARQYVVAAPASGEPSGPAGGDTSEEAYKAYLKEYLKAVPPVDDQAFADFSATMDATPIGPAFYSTYPLDMMFTDMYWGNTAMTYDEFVAAGGVYEIPSFDAGLVAD